MRAEKFHYKTIEEVRRQIELTNAYMPLSDDFSVLFEKQNFGPKTADNRFVIQPMEGCDATDDGSPTELTRRRYLRFAEGGAGTIWFESISICPEGRSTARELMITKQNLDAFKRLITETKEVGLKKNGYAPVILPQITHSGRFCNPTSCKKEPIIAHHNTLFEKDQPLPDSCIATDDMLHRYEEQFGEAAYLCEQAGFDGIDLKACHGYLAGELMCAFDRPGEYGGSFENRIRYIDNCAAAAKSRTSSEFILGCRFNAYDGFAYPFGFGGKDDGSGLPDYHEAIDFVDHMYHRFGISLFNVSCGIGYVNAHVLRPYDNGGYEPPEHPFESLSRHTKATAAIKEAFPDLSVVGSAYTYLRQFSPYLAAGMIGEGKMDLAGFGRMAFAYPDFVNDLRTKGALDPRRVCVTCSQCIFLLRDGQSTGCIVRDREIYKPILKTAN